MGLQTAGPKSDRAMIVVVVVISNNNNNNNNKIIIIVITILNGHLYTATYRTRSSATAERQRVSYTRLKLLFSRFTH